MARLACGWKVAELWRLVAEELLAAGDVGLVPWVPLTHFQGAPALEHRTAPEILLFPFI